MEVTNGPCKLVPDNSATEFGLWLSGRARISLATGDAALRDNAVYLMTEWGKTIESDGNCAVSIQNPALFKIEKDVRNFLFDQHFVKGRKIFLDHFLLLSPLLGEL